VSDQVRVTLPDGSVREIASGTTARGVAESIGAGLARAAVAARVDGAVWDLDRPIERDVSLAILTDRDPDALAVLRHSAAHVLATAVRELFPGAGIGFGPPIEDGFYYDFEVPRPFTPEDLERIESRMSQVAKADYPFVSGPCPARSSRTSPRSGCAIRCSSSTRSTRCRPTSAAIRRRRCSRCSIPSRTPRSTITTSIWTTTSPT
jgi:hypothetical protein